MEPNQPSILEEALSLTTGERQSSYGHPLENFENIAGLWSAYIQVKYGSTNNPYTRYGRLDYEDVAYFCILQKIARDIHKPKRDNLVDIAGYANTIDMARRRRQVRDEHMISVNEMPAYSQRAAAPPESPGIDNPRQNVGKCPYHRPEPGQIVFVPRDYFDWPEEDKEAYIRSKCTCQPS